MKSPRPFYFSEDASLSVRMQNLLRNIKAYTPGDFDYLLHTTLSKENLYSLRWTDWDMYLIANYLENLTGSRPTFRTQKELEGDYSESKENIDDKMIIKQLITGRKYRRGKSYVTFADVYRNEKLMLEHTTIVNEVIEAKNESDAITQAVYLLLGTRNFDYAYEAEEVPVGTSICLDYTEPDGTHIVETYVNFGAEKVNDDY